MERFPTGMRILSRWHPRALFHLGLSDFGRLWELRLFGWTAIRLPWPYYSRNPRWHFRYRRTPAWAWPLISLEASHSGWWLYLFGFVWEFNGD